MKRRLSLLLAGLVIGGTLSVAIPLLYAQQSTNAAPAPTPEVAASRMQAALVKLNGARIDLRHAQLHYGGHREAAIKAVDTAIREINEALKAAADTH